MYNAVLNRNKYSFIYSFIHSFIHLNRFQEEWGEPGAVLSCYYDPNDVNRAIVEKTATTEMIMH